jgi:hypothetical protein
MTDSWTDSWEIFVRSVGDLFAQGFDSATVTNKFAGHDVLWTGRVAAKRQHMNSFGIAMSMPLVEINLPDGRIAKVDYLFLSVRSEQVAAWSSVEVGANLSFATRIRASSDPFLGIEWSNLDASRGLILFRTDGAIPVKAVV